MSAPRRLRGHAPSPFWPDPPAPTWHQAFIRALPCVACGRPASSECAHLGMSAEIGLPSSDRYLVPLCGPDTVWEDCCHSRKHYLGATRFWLRLGIEPLDLAAQLWRVSADVEAGERVIMRARQAVAAASGLRAETGGPSPPRRAERAGWRGSLGMQLPAAGRDTARSELLLFQGSA